MFQGVKLLSPHNVAQIRRVFLTAHLIAEILHAGVDGAGGERTRVSNHPWS